jgi:outer membrane lipoprotein-sorting protein
MKYIQTIVIAALVAISGSLHAQDAKAKAILDKVSNKTRQYATITSDFTFTLEDKLADVNQTQQGSLKMKGKKYYVKLGDNIIYSDGETRWTYNEDMNEVYIDVADQSGDALNPSEIYTIWETGFKQYYEQEITENGKTYDVIKLIPSQPGDKTFHTVKVYVDRAKEELGKIEILGKQGDNYTYNVRSFKTDATYGNEAFVFDPSAHPGVEVIDNR